jgi:cell division protein FtsB
VKFRLRYVAVLIVVIWGAYQYFHVQRAEYQALKSREAALQAQLQAMQEKQKDLEQQAQELQSDDYIARYASQHFNLVMPGQVSFVVHH